MAVKRKIKRSGDMQHLLKEIHGLLQMCLATPTATFAQPFRQIGHNCSLLEPVHADSPSLVGFMISCRFARSHICASFKIARSAKTKSVERAGNLRSVSEIASDDAIRPSLVCTGKSGAPPFP